MATKSKKFKHTFFAKALCFILAALFFFGGTFYGIRLILSCMLFGTDEYFSGNVGSFTSTTSFANKIYSDASSLSKLSHTDADSLKKSLESKMKEEVDKAVNSFLDKKAKIIEEELRYAVENYDDSYFNYEYTAEGITLPVIESTTRLQEEYTDILPENRPSSDSDDDSDEDIPKNIQIAQKILEATTGRDFLAYDILVREDAFDEEFSYTIDLSSITDIYSASSVISYCYGSNYYDLSSNIELSSTLNLTESQVKKEFLTQYQAAVQEINNRYSAAVNEIKYYRLASNENMKYFVKSDDGSTTTNMQKEPDAQSIMSNDIFIYYDGKKTVTGGINKSRITSNLNDIFLSAGDTPIYIYFEKINDGTFPYSDEYSALLSGYNLYSTTSPEATITAIVILMLLAVMFLVILLCLCGHKNTSPVPVTAFTDKLPNDLHTIVSFGLIAGIAALSFALIYEFTDDMLFIYSNSFPQILSLAAVGCFALLTEWLASVVRVKKAGQSWFKHTLIAKLCKSVKNLFVKLASALSYKPKKMNRAVIIIFTGYVLGNMLIFLFAVTAAESGLLPVFVGIDIIYNAVCLVLILKYVVTLDKIIDASCKHENIKLNEQKTPKSLILLAKNLTDTNDELKNAVEKAVKDEQTKTELITNVSHDLKTPLTSLITYSDILKKCNITDEQALKYIEVINTQSTKLKRLIEDLIEASKVSTGNITLNKSVINLSEIAAQAIVEFEPEMKQNGNEIRFSEPEKAPLIFADGSKTYRIIANLLSNAKKYSAEGTRVYISIYNDDSFGYFEIKNISSEPLNISPDELTERFVRGDKSRTREGNGLGLSIAKDLCSLQNGQLYIIIDGDLFKAIVQLPAKQEGKKDTDSIPTITNISQNDNFISTEP